MSKKLRILFLALIFIIQLVIPLKVYAAAPTNCNDLRSSNKAVNSTIDPKGAGDVIQLWHLECLFEKVIGVVAALAGMVALLIIIYSGFKFITAQGDQKAVASAKATLSLAVIGLLMVLVAYFIIDFLARFTGLTQATPGFDLRRFIIPRPY